MSTRCTVSLYDGNGKYHSVYGHWDGYLSGVGRILLDYYNTLETVTELIEMGSFSSIRPTLNDSVFYARDRFEDYELNKPTLYHNIFDIPVQEYNYLYTGTHWFYYDEDRFIRTLTDKRIEEDMKKRRQDVK